MKNYKQISTIALDSITCNSCRKIYDYESDSYEFQEIISVEHFCGYGSVSGDGNKLSIDLCQHCFKKICGDFISVDDAETVELDDKSPQSIVQNKGASSGILANYQCDKNISENESLSDAIDDNEPLANAALNCLQELITRHPEFRLGQLLMNAISPYDTSQVFYMSDKELLEKIKVMKL